MHNYVCIISKIIKKKNYKKNSEQIYYFKVKIPSYIKIKR